MRPGSVTSMLQCLVVRHAAEVEGGTLRRRCLPNQQPAQKHATCSGVGWVFCKIGKGALLFLGSRSVGTPVFHRRFIGSGMMHPSRQETFVVSQPC